jgi:hypothetical protein
VSLEHELERLGPQQLAREEFSKEPAGVPRRADEATVVAQRGRPCSQSLSTQVARTVLVKLHHGNRAEVLPDVRTGLSPNIQAE